MKILAFSDLHIGNKYIDQEVINNLIQDIKINTDPSQTIILFCGDLFHRRVELDTEEARMAIRLLSEINSLNVPCYIIQGTFSHDYNYINTIERVELNNINFIQTLTEKTIANNSGEEIKCLFIPEEYVEDQFEYYKSTVYNKKKVYDIVVMHGTFTDVLFFNNHMESEVLRKAPRFDSKDFSRHTLTVSGHIHRHQILGKKKNVVYVGSYSNMNFGHDVSNNIQLFDIDIANKSFNMETIYNSATHKFLELTIDDNNLEELDKSIISKLKNKSNREHYRVKMLSNDKLGITLLKELKREGYIKSLIIESDSNPLIEKDVKENSDEVNYKEIYHGPINEQIRTFIKEIYDVNVDLDTINKLIV